ncbi:MAG: AMP-binding protein [Thermodesulfobacteriota bacterium]|nr:AMP-binding protein [Thermodesulfobacteriota bacterium]
MNRFVYADLIRESVRKHNDLDFLHIKRQGKYRTWTFREFHKDLNRTVSALINAGFLKGDNGIVIGENTPEWLISYHALMFAGGCAVPVDPNLPGADIREIVRLTDPRVIFCSKVYHNLFTEIQKERSGIQKIVLTGVDCGTVEKDDFYEFIESGDAGRDALEAQFEPDDPVSIVFTSGTTGKAKGVVLVQKNFTAAPCHGVPRMKVTSDDTMLAVLPLHHVFGFATCVAVPIVKGLDVVFIPIIKGSLIIEGMVEKKVSILPAVPRMVELFYNNIERKVLKKGFWVGFIFKRLRGISRILGPVFGKGFRKKLFSSVHKGFGGNLDLIISGGSSLKEKYFNGFKEMGFTIVEGYGLTETFGPITICPYDDIRLGSVGPVLEDNEIKIENPGRDGIGEVLLRGVSVFPRFYNNPEATRQVFDSEGWYHTGDLGRVTDDGFLFITGRKKDLIVLDSGKNIHPDELEQYYLASPVIEEIGIFGINRDGKEIAAAAAVPSTRIRKMQSHENAREIVKSELLRMGKKLPPYKRISSLVVVFEPLLRTTTGKIKKPQLKKLFKSIKRSPGHSPCAEISLTVREQELADTKEYQIVIDIIKGLSAGAETPEINPRTHLQFDLGLDSLKFIECMSLMESRFRLAIPQESLQRIETVGHVVEMIREIKALSPDMGQEPGTDLAARLARESAADCKIRDKGGLFLRFCCLLTYLPGRILWGLKVLGTENLAHDRAVIFIANHASNIDPIWIFGSIPWNIRRKTFILGKAELLQYPILSFFLSRLNMIGVERSGNVMSAINRAKDMLNKGNNLLIFPEGTRTRTGKMGNFRTGAARLMKETGATVIPIRIRGSYEIYPQGKLPKITRPGKFSPSVRFGKSLTMKDFSGKDREKVDYALDVDKITIRFKEIISKM